MHKPLTKKALALLSGAQTFRCCLFGAIETLRIANRMLGYEAYTSASRLDRRAKGLFVGRHCAPKSTLASPTNASISAEKAAHRWCWVCFGVYSRTSQNSR